MANNPTLKEAIKIVQDAMREDTTNGSYYYSWQATIAMAFYDEWDKVAKESGLPTTTEHIHEIANNAAKNFLNLFIS